MISKHKKVIGVLTSSRADYGIYYPLLKRIADSAEYDLSLIAFGSHTSKLHGYTIDAIEADGFEVDYKLKTQTGNDEPNDVSTSMGITLLKFSDFWEVHHSRFALVFCLGDRFEMLAAVLAAVPYGITFAHVHGGEKTLGAMDNSFRHCISHFSKIHFTSLPEYASRVSKLIESSENIHIVGALSLENVGTVKLLSPEEFLEKWGVDLRKPTVLVTVHPETIEYENNAHFADELIKSLEHIVNRFQLLITMPNADTKASAYRKAFLALAAEHSTSVFTIENLGTQSYFTSMKYCSFLLGNTSSGIIEAASFEKNVINLGKRQDGRISGDNVHHVDFDTEAIMRKVENLAGMSPYTGGNIYHRTGSSKLIMQEVDSYLSKGE
ncbi:UDP-N-acetyl-D-glucosamine 2-epimerase, UDP-hydrolysing [Roseivirga sp. 4D4]|uniref:UDP-N-acetylglucosamine 2-epimerase n=1 Tax=Roseivirga sp. 4D4 TaxID=1889784 RepID=UPI0008538379|nr:UDP-N-acetylglucosamine 2-epimerase [Roseivirga sp. 4D4]OEK01632.1 UDP-N-acetyl-D-glucosamine 2-epimerase, UDP-hydrolysing [Roseivirga sp. 4D4]